jgi:hypothetical protein
MRLQLDDGASVRQTLRTAAYVLLAASAPALARGDAGPTTQIEATGLAYGERGRTDVVEPTFRATRLYANGQSLGAQVSIDAMTGASPTGAMPSTAVQTMTTASGQIQTIPAGTLPTRHFSDLRGALDLDWKLPAGVTTTSLTGHVSREKDYQSLGLSGLFALDLFRRTTTLTLGAGGNYDDVSPWSPIRRALRSSRATTVAAGPRRTIRTPSRWAAVSSGSRRCCRGARWRP